MLLHNSLIAFTQADNFTTPIMASGFMLQLLPAQKTQDPVQGWSEAQELIRSLTPELLLKQDNQLTLMPLQDAGDIQLFPERTVSFYCPCSVARMERAVVIMGEEEVQEILEDKQEVVVTCEYCNHTYGFSKDDVARIFR